jgi:hypothetical protein
VTKLLDILLAATALCIAIRLMGWRRNLPDPITLVLGGASAVIVIFRMRKIMMERRDERMLEVSPGEQSTDQIDDAQ